MRLQSLASLSANLIKVMTSQSVIQSPVGMSMRFLVNVRPDSDAVEDIRVDAVENKYVFELLSPLSEISISTSVLGFFPSVVYDVL